MAASSATTPIASSPPRAMALSVMPPKSTFAHASPRPWARSKARSMARRAAPPELMSVPSMSKRSTKGFFMERALASRHGRTTLPAAMAQTYSDLIAGGRKQIKMVSLEEIKRRLDAKEPMVLLDVRESEEGRAGYIPG